MDTRISKQRSALVMDQPFFGALALRLKVVEDPACKTFWVDGEALGYNPAYLDTLNDLECRGVLAHEILHVANGHCFRQGPRDAKRWNDACDYAINPIVKQAGMVLPAGHLDDARFHGKSAEEIYAVLTQEARQKEKEKSGGKPGAQAPGAQQAPANGANTPSAAPDPDAPPSCGEVRPYPGPDKPVKEAEWKVATLQAAKAARMRGKLPGGMQAMVEAAAEPSVDWRSILMRFAQQVTNDDYSFAMPNRRYLHLGFYLPSLHSPAVGDAVFVRDSSGSVFDETQAQFAAEIIHVAEVVRPARLIVMDCDKRVTQVQVFERGDPIELAPVKGGGGTAFTDPFRRLEVEGLNPAFLVYLTDMDGDFPDVPPSYPVLWASTTPLRRARQAPFGEVVEVII
ncbi:VWA-like domain-containing protein [Paraburkholderia sp. CNPSo 3274]|uniref:vWA domain-containing protein n=1 Tax=unclassified Paraburkholderia TaxID=2615204 RepID=UPI0020B8AA7C|nr:MULTISPECIES: VWA-like domain-containing protein [unclassified Paraburkholderia]MCP3712472.1 VWA-like domain-containing protein [Paraburkholderia sp. CNPSo 3274]MCP3718469.1 VWA-like domain-containing protein [Paraburkholderia sp. CNPSo 3281]MCP3724634.1 VWA-like domain-containing protein [Paraburkholderia sp. CNPSo 3272]